MKFTGKITDASIDFVTGVPRITFSVNERNDLLQGFDELRGCNKLSIEITPYRERRSLDANAYCWVLISKLAAKLNVTKTEVYREAIREIGDNSNVACVKSVAVDKLRKEWEKKGIGWITDTFPSKFKGFTNVVLYYGSSTYNTEQMSRLIDNIVQECKEQGIQTESPAKLAKMKTMWGE